MGSQKKEAILQAKWAVKKAKWAVNFVKKQNGQRMSFEFLDQCFQTGNVSPATAAAERVFSILQHFTGQQQSSLEDYLELFVMLQYNLAH